MASLLRRAPVEKSSCLEIGIRGRGDFVDNVPAGFYKVSANRAVSVGVDGARYAKFDASALEVLTLDVGAGEAILVKAPTGESLLVDGGCTRKSVGGALASGLASLIVRRALTAFVASHPHSDHLNAVRFLAKSHEEILSSRISFFHNGRPPTGATWWRILETTLKAARNGRGIPLVAVKAGKPATEYSLLGDAVKVTLFANPYRSAPYQSVFMRLDYRNASLLFTGDSYCDYENGLLDTFGPGAFRADVLKVTHHGSQDGTSVRLVEKVKPGIAIASTHYEQGQPKNKQDHAWEKAARDRLRKGTSGCLELETWFHGDILLRTDGLSTDGGVLYHVSSNRPGRVAAALELQTKRDSYEATQKTTDTKCAERPGR